MTGNEISQAARRSRLTTAPNPGERHDAMVLLEATAGFMGAERPVTVTLLYVPDRLVLPPGQFSAYLEALDGCAWPTPEAAAAAVLADVNNELIPRWVQVRLAAAAGRGDGRGGGLGAAERHSVILEDRQPGWDNPDLLGRLAPI